VALEKHMAVALEQHDLHHTFRTFFKILIVGVLFRESGLLKDPASIVPALQFLIGNVLVKCFRSSQCGRQSARTLFVVTEYRKLVNAAPTKVPGKVRADQGVVGII